MAKQITRLEPSDINLRTDALHSLLYGTLAITALLLTTPPKEGEDKQVAYERNGIAAVMTFLNVLEESGYTITKKEDIPSAFIREG